MVPTVGQNVQKIESNNVKWTIWDLGGQKRLRDIWDTYFRDVDVLIWVLDSTFYNRSLQFLMVVGAEPSRFQESVDAFKKVIADSQLEFVPVCILANKQD